MCGAESSTVTVAIIVNSVKTIKQNRSTTIAANFQSLIKSCSSSRFFIRPVMNCNSFRIKCRSLCEQPPIELSSTVVGRLNLSEGMGKRRKIGFCFHFPDGRWILMPRKLFSFQLTTQSPDSSCTYVSQLDSTLCILLAQSRSPDDLIIYSVWHAQVAKN